MNKTGRRSDSVGEVNVRPRRERDKASLAEFPAPGKSGYAQQERGRLRPVCVSVSKTKTLLIEPTGYCDLKMKEKTYHWALMIEVPGRNGNTTLWEVILIKGRKLAGMIRWNRGWRCYAFYPDPLLDSLENNCLWEIADFVAEQTENHRAGKEVCRTMVQRRSR